MNLEKLPRNRVNFPDLKKKLIRTNCRGDGSHYLNKKLPGDPADVFNHVVSSDERSYVRTPYVGTVTSSTLGASIHSNYTEYNKTSAKMYPLVSRVFFY